MSRDIAQQVTEAKQFADGGVAGSEDDSKPNNVQQPQPPQPSTPPELIKQRDQVLLQKDTESAALKAKLEEDIKAEKARAQSQLQSSCKQYDEAKKVLAAMAEAKLEAQSDAFRIKEEQFKQEQERVQQQMFAERAHNMKIIADSQAEHANLQERIIAEAKVEHAKLRGGRLRKIRPIKSRLTSWEPVLSRPPPLRRSAQSCRPHTMKPSARPGKLKLWPGT